MSSNDVSTVGLHPGRQLVHRLLEAGQVDEHELVVLAVRDAVDPPSRRVRDGEVIAIFSPTSAFTSVDLPTFGRPATATKPDFIRRGSSQVSGSRSAAAYARSCRRRA